MNPKHSPTLEQRVELLEQQVRDLTNTVRVLSHITDLQQYNKNGIAAIRNVPELEQLKEGEPEDS